MNGPVELTTTLDVGVTGVGWAALVSLSFAIMAAP